MQEWQDPSTADEQGEKNAERLKQTLAATLAETLRQDAWLHASLFRAGVRFVLFLSSRANHKEGGGGGGSVRALGFPRSSD